MEENKKDFIMNDLRNKLNWLHENTDYHVAGIFVQGSTNYNLDLYTETYQSDIDTKAIIIPSFDDIIYNKKPVSKVYVMEDNSHIEVKDIRLMLDIWYKANATYLEILFTDYYILENKALFNILDMKDDIAQMNIPAFLKCIDGKILNKSKTMYKMKVVDNRYYSSYNPKDFHHIVRLYLLKKHFLKTYNFKEAMTCEGDYRNLLLYYKKQDADYVIQNTLTLSERIVIANDILKKSQFLTKTNQIPFNTQTYKKLKETIYSMIKDVCIQEAISTNK